MFLTKYEQQSPILNLVYLHHGPQSDVDALAAEFSAQSFASCPHEIAVESEEKHSQPLTDTRDVCGSPTLLRS